MVKNYSDHTFSNNQVFLIMTGFSCNNNCVMCSVRPKGVHFTPRSRIDILKDLKEGQRLKFERAEFTGGEPTIREDLLELVSEATKLGYREIALSTNGRALSSLQYLKSLKKNGLNRVTITLYSGESKVHDSITRVPGSFEQTVQGIKNSLSLGIVTTINTAVFNRTINGLKKTGEFLVSLGAKYWTLLDLIPDGYALTNYKILSVNPQKLRKIFASLYTTLKKFEVVNFFDFAYCLFPEKLLNQSNMNIIAAKGRAEAIHQVGYNPKRFQKEDSVYYDIHKTRGAQCQNCAYEKECGGIWTLYKQLYGGTAFKSFESKIIRQ